MYTALRDSHTLSKDGPQRVSVLMGRSEGPRTRRRSNPIVTVLPRVLKMKILTLMIELEPSAEYKMHNIMLGQITWTL